MSTFCMRQRRSYDDTPR